MENSLLDSNLTEENYDDYIEKIFNIFRLSSKNSSIILSVDIVDSKCLIKLKIVSQNGDIKEFSDVTFKCDNAFYNDFLDSLIKRLNDDENFIINDIVNLDKDEFMTFRLVSSNNDLITIDGLTKEQANHLNKLFETDEKKEEILINNSGIANVWIFLLMIVVLVISFILIVMFFK